MSSAGCSGGGDARTRPWRRIRIGGRVRTAMRLVVGGAFGRTATGSAPRRRERESLPSGERSGEVGKGAGEKGCLPSTRSMLRVETRKRTARLEMTVHDGSKTCLTEEGAVMQFDARRATTSGATKPHHTPRRTDGRTKRGCNRRGDARRSVGRGGATVCLLRQAAGSGSGRRARYGANGG